MRRRDLTSKSQTISPIDGLRSAVLVRKPENLGAPVRRHMAIVSSGIQSMTIDETALRHLMTSGAVPGGRRSDRPRWKDR
jgi:hypothetical protein